jgi:hypothetical protein
MRILVDRFIYQGLRYAQEGLLDTDAVVPLETKIGFWL